jgi:ABC-2 type transport system permease protein
MPLTLSGTPITPVGTILRLSVSGIPAWQLIVSLSVLCLSIVGGLWLGVRVFRTHLLVHGMRPSLGEIARNLRRR